MATLQRYSILAWEDLIMLVSVPMLVAGLRGGWVGSFPTDTLPALAVRPENRDRVYALKQRPARKPLILMGSDLGQLWRFVDGDHPNFGEWETIARRYLPGALTLVLPTNSLGRKVNPDFDSLGVRVPNHPLALSILQQTGALLTTSANLSGSAPLLDMPAISAQFPEVLVVAGAGGMGLPSTVVGWEGGGWRILRQGAVSFEGSAGC